MTSRALDDLETVPLRAVMALAGPKARLIEHRCVAMAAEFCRDRQHEIELSFADDAVASVGMPFVRLLREHEFEIAGLMVVSTSLTRARFCPGPRAELFLEVQLVVWELPWVAAAVAA